MTIFNSYVKLPEGNTRRNYLTHPLGLAAVRYQGPVAAARAAHWHAGGQGWWNGFQWDPW